MRHIPQFGPYNKWADQRAGVILSEMITLDPPKTLSSDLLVNDHGWPHSLCLIEPAPGKYACNCADTEGLEPDPQHDVHGLAVFSGEESAKAYMGSLNGLSGTVVAKTFEECRQAAIDRPTLVAMFLMEGSKIRDICYVR